MIKQFSISSFALLSFLTAANAATTDELLARLEALERKQAQTEKLLQSTASENASLRRQIKSPTDAQPRKQSPVAVANEPQLRSSMAMAAPYTKAVSATSSYDWSGFYIGGHGGGVWGHETFSQGFFMLTPGNTVLYGNPPNLLTGTQSRGSVIGGQFGYNSQIGDKAVVGIEADFSTTTIKGSQSVTNVTFPVVLDFATQNNTLDTKLRYLGTVRAKLGFIGWPGVLVYGTGGLAWGQVDEAVAVTLPNTPFAGPFNYSGSATRFGWSAGVGADWKVWPNVVLGVLYLHHDLGSASVAMSGFGANSIPTTATLPKSNFTADTVTARISWLFNSGR